MMRADSQMNTIEIMIIGGEPETQTDIISIIKATSSSTGARRVQRNGSESGR